MIMRIGREAGHVVEKNRAQRMAERQARTGWTTRELELAEDLILTDAELTKQISYERTVGPGVLALAKERPEVMAGRLHTRREAVAFCRDQDETEVQALLSEIFEPVYVQHDDGDEEMLWAMKDRTA